MVVVVAAEFIGVCQMAHVAYSYHVTAEMCDLPTWDHIDTSIHILLLGNTHHLAYAKKL